MQRKLNHIGDSMQFPLLKKFRTIVTLLKHVSVLFDEESNTVVIKNGDIPLNIAVEGQLRLLVDDDFELQTTGQLDFISHGSLITLDALNSKIYLNSRRSKYCDSMSDRFSKVNRQVQKEERGKHRKEYDRISYEALFNKVQDLDTKLTELQEINNNLTQMEDK